MLHIVQVVLSVAVIFLVLMHSGKDAGLSGAFGVGSGSGPLGGGSPGIWAGASVGSIASGPGS